MGKGRKKITAPEGVILKLRQKKSAQKVSFKVKLTYLRDIEEEPMYELRDGLDDRVDAWIDTE